MILNPIDLISVILIGIGLSMDAFAVAVAKCASNNRINIFEAMKMPIAFGFFQALMPVIGFFAGSIFHGYISSYDHWAAFFILFFIGAKMIIESGKKDKKIECTGENRSEKERISFPTLFALAIATSIDALAVGISFAFLQIEIFLAAIIIGAITFTIVLLGVFIGKRFGKILGKRAELFGGIILIAIGIKILLEHLL